MINDYTSVPFISNIATRVCGDLPLILTCHAASLYKYKNLIFNYIHLLIQDINRKKYN